MALRRFAVDVAALTAARVLQTVASFLAIPILARLLGPADFGLIAMASTFVVFTMVMSDAGLGQTLVRVPARERDVWSSAFWFIALIGAGLAIFLAIIAAPIAWLMQESRLTPVILALAPLPLVQALVAPGLADLQQRERFRHLASAELAGSISGVAAAIGFALAGFGVWALVSQQLVYWLVKASIVTFSSTFRPALMMRMSVLGPHIAFGRDTAALGIVAFFQRQMDPLVIGRLLGTVPVGLFSVAGRIASLPQQFLSMPLQNALFTRMVMLRNDKEALTRLLMASAWMVAAIVFPGMAVGAAAAEAYFRFFLSDKWADAAIIFSFTAPTMAFQAVMILCGTMLLAIGATGRRLRLNVEFTIVWLTVLPLAALHSIEAVALSYAVAYALYSIRSYPLFLEPVGCTAGTFFRVLAAPILVAATAAGVHLGVRSLWPMNPGPEVLVSFVVLLTAWALLAYIERGKVAERIDVFRTVLAQRHIDQSPQPEESRA
ncbi:MAG: lipopolysaccharide biosynthesis protein [Hyphomonadaceae bacterium]